MKRRVALLIDVDNVKISKDAVEELLDELNNSGEVVYCKFYGYNDRKHLYLNDLITNFGYETAPFMRLKKRYSQLDNRIIVDAVRINYTKPDIDAFCIVAGEGDLIPLLVELKSCGKTVIDINTEYQQLNAHMFDEHIYITSITQGAETYTSKTKKVAQPKAKTTKKATTTSTATKRVSKPAKPVYEEVEDDYEDDVQTVYVAKQQPTQVRTYAQPAPQPQPAYVQAAPVYVQPAPQPMPQPQPAPQPAPAKAPVVEEEDYGKYFKASKVSNDDLDDYIEDEYYEEPDGEYDLSEVLKDITSRYNNLDFTNGDNMSEKLKLIRDIENLIQKENAKGEGIYSDNEDIRQIFADLQDVVDDMKNAL